MAKPYPQLLLLGDSLLQSCAPLQTALATTLIRRTDIINRGLSGYNTSQTLFYLPQIITPYVPESSTPRITTLIVLLGANDAVHPLPTTNQGISLESYKENLAAILTHPIITSHAPQILLVTPPPLDEIKIAALDRAWGHHQTTRTSSRSSQFSQACRDVAAQLNSATSTTKKIILIDLWKALMNKAMDMCPGFSRTIAELEADGRGYLGDPKLGLSGGLDTLLPDGLHMNDEAYDVLTALVMPYVMAELEGKGPNDRLGYVLPDWQEAEWLEKDRVGGGSKA